MSSTIRIALQDIIHQVKISFQMPSLIKKSVIYKLIISKAAELSIVAEVTELQQAADQFRLLNRLSSEKDTWLWLKHHHLSLDVFEEMIHLQVVSAKLAQYLFNDQVESFFLEHQSDYAQAALYEIVLEDPDLAMELFYSLREDEIRFSEIASEYIQDVELRRVCGYRGWLSRKMMRPDISTSVFAANPPQIIKPIVTSQGVHLIQVEEIRIPVLSEQLHQEILGQLFLNWLEFMIEQSNIVVEDME
jgi:parvulin-like peptidyl-prolyl isomerase